MRIVHSSSVRAIHEEDPVAYTSRKWLKTPSRDVVKMMCSFLQKEEPLPMPYGHLKVGDHREVDIT